MKAIVGLGGVCWAVILGMAGVAYVPQFIDSFLLGFPVTCRLCPRRCGGRRCPGNGSRPMGRKGLPSEGR